MAARNRRVTEPGIVVPTLQVIANQATDRTQRFNVDTDPVFQSESFGGDWKLLSGCHTDTLKDVMVDLTDNLTIARALNAIVSKNTVMFLTIVMLRYGKCLLNELAQDVNAKLKGQRLKTLYENGLDAMTDAFTKSHVTQYPSVQNEDLKGMTDTKLCLSYIELAYRGSGVVGTVDSERYGMRTVYNLIMTSNDGKIVYVSPPFGFRVPFIRAVYQERAAIHAVVTTARQPALILAPDCFNFRQSDWTKVAEEVGGQVAPMFQIHTPKGYRNLVQVAEQCVKQNEAVIGSMVRYYNILKLPLTYNAAMITRILKGVSYLLNSRITHFGVDPADWVMLDTMASYTKDQQNLRKNLRCLDQQVCYTKKKLLPLDPTSDDHAYFTRIITRLESERLRIKGLLITGRATDTVSFTEAVFLQFQRDFGVLDQDDHDELLAEHNAPNDEAPQPAEENVLTAEQMPVPPMPDGFVDPQNQEPIDQERRAHDLAASVRGPNDVPMSNTQAVDEHPDAAAISNGGPTGTSNQPPTETVQQSLVSAPETTEPRIPTRPPQVRIVSEPGTVDQRVRIRLNVHSPDQSSNANQPAVIDGAAVIMTPDDLLVQGDLHRRNGRLIDANGQDLQYNYLVDEPSSET